MSEPIYTQEQHDILLLKNNQEHILRVLDDMKGEIHSMHQYIKSQSHWNIGLILGIYAMIGAAALGKIFGVL